MEYLSDIELYFTQFIQNDSHALIGDDEFKHITRVMRHTVGDEIYFTNGKGSIFKGNIFSIGKDNLNVSIKERYNYLNKFSNIIFCLPKLKNPDRFEFALEKCVEFGITRFVVFNSSRSFTKGEKLERWNKITLAAMKQSLRCFLPVVENVVGFNELIKLPGEKILFDQNADKKLSDFKFDETQTYFFIFGPEGGLSEAELKSSNGGEVYKLAENRLRSETAVVKCAAVLSELLPG
ncbi:MAG: 16S rRNA (uracil(1498)-N(3))-methyltransferase [Ignavibacteriaceae bacterium]|nr:16S rRNA (uracil(1498)-N(3))-methyltransferase [Ignavibacteriaceae bacterium]